VARHREETALGAVRAFGLAQLPIAVGEFLGALLGGFEFCAEMTIAPCEQPRGSACSDEQRAL
jgi:hypothetical protein